MPTELELAVDNEELEFIRKRQFSLMPQSMKDFSKEFTSRSIPSELDLTKHEYIHAWFAVFDKVFANDVRNDPNFTDKYMRFNVLELMHAFKWTLSHFAELDLGGNMKWYAASQDALKIIKAKKWNADTQAQLIHKYIAETRWYDY